MTQLAVDLENLSIRMDLKQQQHKSGLYDALMNGVAATILFWSGEDTSVATKLTEAVANGGLGQNSGVQTDKEVVDIGAYKNSLQTFFGLYHIDGYVQGNYRLKEELSGSDTRFYQLKTGFVLSCPTINKAQCLA